MSKDRVFSNDLNLYSSLIQWSSALEDFVHSRNTSASIKDAKESRFKVCSPVMAKLLDVSEEACVGLTIQDIGQLMYYKPAVVEHAMAMDQRIYKGILPYIQYKQSIPIKGGCIIIESVTKRPVYSKAGNVIGLLAYANDITSYVEPLHLLALYRKYYPIKLAIERLLDCLKIQHFFYALPTQRELEILLVMRKSTASKYIASQLRISPKTIAEHKARLRNNLKSITLSDLVIKLRIRHELQEIS